MNIGANVTVQHGYRNSINESFLSHWSKDDGTGLTLEVPLKLVLGVLIDLT